MYFFRKTLELTIMRKESQQGFSNFYNYIKFSDCYCFLPLNIFSASKALLTLLQQ